MFIWFVDDQICFLSSVQVTVVVEAGNMISVTGYKFSFSSYIFISKALALYFGLRTDGFDYRYTIW